MVSLMCANGDAGVDVSWTNGAGSASGAWYVLASKVCTAPITSAVCADQKSGAPS